MFHPLTVIIPCKNEREHLAACVASAKQLAADVLVADSGSTDGSLEIARALGCRVIEREYRTSGDFKNWAIPQAANPWVLILDADERITPELAAEISRVLERPKHDGYRIRRRNHFLGHPIRFGPWRNDDCLRLFRRDVGRYVGPTDHAEVVISTGKVGWLDGADDPLHLHVVRSVPAEAAALRRGASRPLASGGPTRQPGADALSRAAAILPRLCLAARFLGWPGWAASLPP